jgi:lysozyme family protein
MVSKVGFPFPLSNCFRVLNPTPESSASVSLGNKTIAAANSIPPQVLFDALTTERERFFRYIGRPGSKNAKFLKGWLNRLADYKKTFRP